MAAVGAALVPPDDFPLLSRHIEGRRVIYLDSAATSLKPRCVIEAVTRFYSEETANVHRGAHTLGQEASERFEAARHAVARLVNATSREIVFTASATEAINLVAGGLDLASGDNVVVAIGDHHSNILPWMSRCEVRFAPEDGGGRIDLDRLASLVDGRTRLVSVGHVSNVTGAIQPVADVIAIAHARGVPVMLDGAQSVPHLPVDVLALGCDLLAFSGHKLLGPSGVGVLYISQAMAERVKSSKLGGGVPDHVRTDGFALKGLPHRLEAGTPNIEGVIGLGAAVEYLEALGMERVAAHGQDLARLLHARLAPLPGLELLGPAGPERTIGIASLAVRGGNLDVTTLGHVLSDTHKVMARSGTHCAHPYFESRGLHGALRLSTHVYTSRDDVEIAAAALAGIVESMGR